MRVVTIDAAAHHPYVPNGTVAVGDPLVLSPSQADADGDLCSAASREHRRRLGRGNLDLHHQAAGELLNRTVRRSPIWDARRGGRTSSISRQLDRVGGGLWTSAFVTICSRRYIHFVPGLLPSTGFESATVGEPRRYGVPRRFRFGGMVTDA